MVMVIPPKFSIAVVMATLKSQSASRMRKAFKFLEKVYWKENVVWSPGYFVSSVGIDDKVIKNCVEYQGRQDSGQLRMKL
jgi:putative transposase